MLSVLLLVVILHSVKETLVHNAFTLITLVVIYATSVLLVVAVVMAIYVTDVGQVVVIMHA